jgi:hypothetical protein
MLSNKKHKIISSLVITQRNKKLLYYEVKTTLYFTVINTGQKTEFDFSFACYRFYPNFAALPAYNGAGIHFNNWFKKSEIFIILYGKHIRYQPGHDH